MALLCSSCCRPNFVWMLLFSRSHCRRYDRSSLPSCWMVFITDVEIKPQLFGFGRYNSLCHSCELDLVFLGGSTSGNPLFYFLFRFCLHPQVFCAIMIDGLPKLFILPRRRGSDCHHSDGISSLLTLCWIFQDVRILGTQKLVVGQCTLSCWACFNDALVSAKLVATAFPANSTVGLDSALLSRSLNLL